MPLTACAGLLPSRATLASWTSRRYPRASYEIRDLALPGNMGFRGGLGRTRYQKRTSDRRICDEVSASATRGDESYQDVLWGQDSTNILRTALMKAQALESFRSLAADIRDKEPVDLLQASLLLAKHRYPMLNAGQYESVLDEWAREIDKQLEGTNRYPLVVLKAISRYLFVELGFRGNSSDYYSPDNSCLNIVIEKREGIPITLSLVYMEVARRLGINMHGVNMPSHFLLRPEGDDLRVFVDTFQDGKIIFLEDAEELLGKLWGVKVQLDPKWVERNEPLPNDRFMLRMLSNLKYAYMLSRDASSLLTILDYIKAIARTVSPEDLRDEGMCYLALQRWPEAIDTLNSYIEASPEAKDVDRVNLAIEKANMMIKSSSRTRPDNTV
eukprot:CAMPEP_0117661266 /NCGR_PEP_ID=MMETSP0804-20121206/7446_1 /TAXON_ID=1074897 /ORGANISM="Tetraselmis astigmatica, Strain CCMP880" /LENGTH=384 /DNA_ID=CAMNT_0005468123 /DNA_START=245 /DNA_END=1399 /DNA_ORIENTATION=-